MIGYHFSRDIFLKKGDVRYFLQAAWEANLGNPRCPCFPLGHKTSIVARRAHLPE
jgi:hypothetical protein